MRRFFTFQLLLLWTLNSIQAQNKIDSLVVYPSNPTVNDSIQVIAYYTFTSSSCPLDVKSFSQSGNTINASSLHCLGMLSTICNSSDTFALNRMQSGNYSFKLSLSAGALTGPSVACTPGIVPDDSTSINFSVRPLLTTLTKLQAKAIQFYPNPVQDKLYFKQLAPKSTIRIANQLGQVVLKTTSISTQGLDVSKLEQGIYFIEVTTNQIRHQFNFIKIP